MPETLAAQIEEVSEAALIERIQMRKVKAAVDLYDQLLQAGKNEQDGALHVILWQMLVVFNCVTEWLISVFCAGTSVSLDVTNQLFDLICFYGDHDPAQENVPEQKNEETVGMVTP